jgi:predicted amidohydrolase
VRFTIACGQLAPTTGDIAGNTARMRALAGEAARAGATVLVLPELCLCGYLRAEDARARAVAATGPEIAGLRACARENRIALAFGFAEAAPGGALHNSMAFVDSLGTLTAVYRKVHLWATEKTWAEPGASFSAFDALGIRAGMWVCYDSRFPEAARTLARAGATLALVGSAWFGPAEEWELALRARALDNGIFVAGAAVLGSFGDDPFHGESLIVDPHGAVLAKAASGRSGIICGEYDTTVVEGFRARLPLLADLRPGSYA